MLPNFYFKIIRLIKDDACNLEVNTEKTRVINYLNHEDDLNGNYVGFAPYETLGINLKRNSIDIGLGTKSKRARLKSKSCLNISEKKSKKGLNRYTAYIRS